VSAALRVLVLGAGTVLRKLNPINRETISPLECGFERSSTFRLPFSLRFYVFAVIFVIFDVELVIVFPALLEAPSSMSFFFIYWAVVNLLSLGLFVE